MIEMLWLAAVVVFIILEAVTYQMISVWFIIGSVGALIASLLGAEFWLQMVIFVALSLVLLVMFRPFAVKRLKTDFKTNADAAVGKKVTITQAVDNTKGTGEAKLDGLVWSVRTQDGNTLGVGEVAEVKRIEGVKLIVG
ncbi:MAG: NfeD family protein [Clostridiales bacterium]|nr:NfeD family protein [Clostridiales bacterium]